MSKIFFSCCQSSYAKVLFYGKLFLGMFIGHPGPSLAPLVIRLYIQAQIQTVDLKNRPGFILFAKQIQPIILNVWGWTGHLCINRPRPTLLTYGSKNLAPTQVQTTTLNLRKTAQCEWAWSTRMPIRFILAVGQVSFQSQWSVSILNL